MRNLLNNSYERAELIKTVAATGTPERITARTITSIARTGTTNQVVVTTSEPHGYTEGARVYITGGTGDEFTNTTTGYLITVLSATTFAFYVDGDESGACVESAIVPGTGLLSWWNLTDHVSAFSGTDSGPSGLNFVDNSAGTPPTYVNDTARGAGIGSLNFDAAPPVSQSGLKVTDAGGVYIATGTDFTIGMWVKIHARNAAGDLPNQNGSILSYHVGTSVKYRFLWSPIAGHIRFRCLILTGAENVILESTDEMGTPELDTWYWLEMFWDTSANSATFRVLPSRTTPFDTPGDAGQTKVVPVFAVAAGALSVGYYGSGVQMPFIGEAGPIGFWNRELTECERGRINKPTDYPFTALAARTCYADMYVRQATVVGQKSAQVNNTGNLRLGLSATDATASYLIAPGGEVSLNGGMPDQTRINLGSYWVDVETAADGVVVLYS